MSYSSRLMVALLFVSAFLNPGRYVTADETSDSLMSDQTADALLSAMKAQDYSAAFQMFDSKMKTAISEARLKAIWEEQLKSVGSLRSWTITGRSQSQGRNIRIAILKFERGELQSTIAADPQKRAVAGFFLRPAPPPAPPAPYVDPSRFRDVDISVGTNPFILGGTLTVPMQLDPSPGVVLVHGSGPHDRDETIGANRIFKDLAEGLASRGIAVLRYDKRTFRYGDKLGDSISVDDEVVHDAVAALNTLRARPEVNSQRLFVLGHSLGALLAPEIAVRSAPVAGIVLLAPPGRSPWDMVISQMRYLGAPRKEIADVEERVNRLKSGTLGKETLLGAPQSYWKDLAARDGLGTAKKLAAPILILRGDRDYQVTEEDLKAWRAGLAGIPNAEVATIAGVNHLFIAGKGRPGPSEYSTPGHVDGSIIERIASFLVSPGNHSTQARPNGGD